MNATTKKSEKKSVLDKPEKTTEKKETIFYDENGKRISRAGYMMRLLSGTGKILDMKAVLK
ncbi:hypothetical protein [Capnocytophaga sp.]|uniref:hypothetical protein n=1 Tax=Capnocytophaga sp. TaxID=44737 RepID=UPI0026DB2EF5|nr:hypothetical protein [Capnocytophaga sp.]MDO5105042.1 hypothetical protein [Capnocytophaga sp.]